MNGGVGNTLYEPAFPIVFAPFEGDWYDAAIIYKTWAIPNAVWLKQGKMADRTDIPNWIYNITTWVNSHWQNNDIFNITGGDPTVVLSNIMNIVERLGLEKDALALHWYEWDTLGYILNSKYEDCVDEVTCGFDTHYPEYFPVREGFHATLKKIQELGVKVAPYINGRIVDQKTKFWTRDNNSAFESACKKSNGVLNATSSDLTTYDE